MREEERGGGGERQLRGKKSGKGFLFCFFFFVCFQERAKESKMKLKRIDRTGEKYELSRWTPLVQDIAEVSNE